MGDIAVLTGVVVRSWLPGSWAVSEVREGLAGLRSGDGAAGNLAGVARGANVIVLQLESHQAFLVGARVGGKAVAPNLERLVAESLHFQDTWDQTGGATTADADLLVNCSLFPSPRGTAYYLYATNSFRCLPALLAEQGYETAAFQGAERTFWNVHQMYPRIGFRRYDSLDDYGEEARRDTARASSGWLADEPFLRESAHKLLGLSEPFYAYIATLSTHEPLDDPRVTRMLDTTHLVDPTFGDYLQAAHYTDTHVGRFIDVLRETGLLDRSVLVVHGDHTFLRRNNPAAAAFLGLAPSDEIAWFDAERRIPLLIRLPKGFAAHAVDHPAGLADVAPTLQRLLGLPEGRDAFLGADLLGTGNRAVALRNGSAVATDRIWMAPAARDPDGTCVDRRRREAVPASECLPIAQATETVRRLSLTMLERDIIPEVVADH